MKSQVARDAKITETAREHGDDALVLSEFLPYRLSVLANTVSRGMARLYSEQFAMTVPEWRVMAVLGSFGPMTANDAAARTAMDKVQVSRAVSRLLKAGRLTRREDPDDRRRAVLDFTPEGRAVYQEIVPLALARERALLDGIGDEDRAALDRLLEVLLDRGRAVDAQADGTPIGS